MWCALCIVQAYISQGQGLSIAVGYGSGVFQALTLQHVVIICGVSVTVNPVLDPPGHIG